MITATTASRVSFCVYRKSPSTRFILEITIRSQDGKKRLRRIYPTREIAELAQKFLSQQEDLIECVNRGMIEDPEAQKAVAEIVSASQKKRDELKQLRRIEKARLREVKRKQAEELRIKSRQLAVIESHEKKQRTPEEIEDAKRRGLERRRERMAASDQQRSASEHSRRSSAAIAEKARIQKREARKQHINQRLRKRREFQAEILARTVSERMERTEFVGADYIRTMFENGFISREQAILLVRLDGDPDTIICALQSAEHGCPGGTIDKLLRTYKPIPVDEHLTRFCIQFYSGRCRAEFRELKSLMVETLDDEPDWLFDEPSEAEFIQAL